MPTLLNSKKIRNGAIGQKLDARPSDIPAYPDEVYKDEWTSWGDFLGTGVISVLHRTYTGHLKKPKFLLEL